MARQRGARSFLPMPTYLIEREIPGASNLTDEELRGITATSNDAVATLKRPYEWRHSYVAGDKIYCVHEAESADVDPRARQARRLPGQPGGRGHGGLRPHRAPLASGLSPA